MARTFVAVHPRNGRWQAVVEVRTDEPQSFEQELTKLKRVLYERRVSVGMLVTPARAAFIRDTFGKLEFSEASYAVGEIATAELLSRTTTSGAAKGERLFSQVETWLRRVAESWSSAVPDAALPHVLPELVGMLAEASIEEWPDDVLETGE